MKQYPDEAICTLSGSDMNYINEKLRFLDILLENEENHIQVQKENKRLKDELHRLEVMNSAILEQYTKYKMMYVENMSLVRDNKELRKRLKRNSSILKDDVLKIELPTFEVLYV